MKRFLSLIAVAAIVAASCTKLGIPTIEFANVIGKFYDGTESTKVAVRVNIPQDSDCKLTIKASYLKDLKEVDSKNIDVTIPAGEKETVVEIPNIEAEVNSINLTLTNLPQGFVWGGKLVCVLTPSNDEAIIYSFVSETANLHESLQVKLNLTGAINGNDWKADSDMQFKATIEGDLKNVTTDQYFRVNAGESTAVLTLSTTVTDCNERLVISVSDPALFDGDNTSCTVAVMGLPTAKTLAGTWKFSELIDAEEMELWFMELEDDFTLCPANNNGFQFSISDNGGALTLTPNTTGDFAKYFRTATMTPCAPVNTVAKAVTLGSCTAEEGHMFISEVYMPYQQSIFYELSSVNRSFDTTEKLGKGAMSIAFMDADNIFVTIRDYDEPPFGFMWWDTTFDSEMFGFASVFTRAK